MKDVIIKTPAMLRFDAAVESVLAAGKGLSGFILAHGQAGRGKSVAADCSYCGHGGAYVRVWQGWSQTAFLQRLLFEVRGKNEEMPRHSGNRCKELIVEILNSERKTLYIDEADRLHIDRIEDLRDVHEITGAPIVLIGEEGLYGLLSERRRIWSRVIHEVEFGPIQPTEVAIYALQASGLNIPPALCKQISAKSEGDFRLVRNMMILLEAAAAAAETETVDEAMLKNVFAQRNWRRR